MQSFIYNDQGQVTKFTGGYVVDKELGTSGGLGGLFGIKYATGRPFPFREGKAWKPSFGFRLFSFIGSIVAKLSKK